MGVGVGAGQAGWGGRATPADPAALLPADYLYDEPYCFWNNTKDPDCKMYRLLRTKTDAIHAQHPDALVYVNGGDGSGSGMAAFDDKYLEIAQPDVMSFDDYPSFGGSMWDAKKGLIGVHDSRKTYLDFLAAARETSLRHDKPFWNCKTRWVSIYAHACRSPVSPFQTSAPLALT